MRFRVLDADAPDGLAAWASLWRSWPERETMAHPEYARLFARPCDRTVCAVGEDDGGVILFPLVLRPISAETWSRPGERRCDATTPYGYSGPFAWGSGSRDDDAFWRSHASWCREVGIVSTFARLSLFPEQLAQIPIPVEIRGANIVRTLDGGIDAIWRDYAHKVRKNVNTAERAGLSVEADLTGARLDDFRRIYTDTMRRRIASAGYFFPPAFFEAIRDRLQQHYVFFHVVSGTEVLSSELVLCSQAHVYSFLGGTRADAFDLRPNDLLKHRVISWAIAQGKRAFVLGGGYEPGDGIFRYKLAFAPRGQVPFSVACMVHDESSYRELERVRQEFEMRHGRDWIPRPGFFPAYRG